MGWDVSCRQWQRECEEVDRVICLHLPACARARCLWLGPSMKSWRRGSSRASRLAGRPAVAAMRCDGQREGGGGGGGGGEGGCGVESDHELTRDQGTKEIGST